MPVSLKILLAAALVFCLPLSPAAAYGAETPPNPLAATGLIARPDENAEDILMRAHQRDIPAMVLAAAGYGKGVGGFPQDRYLAAGWISQLSTLGAVDEVSLAALLLWEEEFGASDSPDIFAGLLANCAFAGKSPYAAAFQKAGLFDAGAFCAEREKLKKDFPDWEKRYRSNSETMELIRERSAFARALARELRTRPATQEDKENMFGALNYVSAEAVLFFAATTHDPAAQRPDWSAARLLEFFLTQSPVTPGEFPRSEGEIQWTFQSLVGLAGRLLSNTLPEPRGRALEPIRTAHAAATVPFDRQALDAMHTLARNYRDGSDGFVKDEELSRCWIQRAAFGGDAAAMLALALHLLDEESPAEAWVWASMAAEAGGDAAPLGRAVAERIEKAAGDELMARARALRTEYLKEKTERMERRAKTPPAE